MSTEAQYRYRVEPAGTVIRALGGVRETARRLRLSPEAVSQWNRPAARGGTGGFVPSRYWDRVLTEAARLRRHDVTRDLLASAVREKIDMPNRQRQKGDRFERQVVEDLRAAGFDAHRVPLSGAMKDYVGDVEIWRPQGRFVIQCKHTRDHTAGGRQIVARMLGQVAFGRVRTGDGGDLVAMRDAVFIALLRGDALPRVVNMPRVVVFGRQIVAHLKDHDALLFRRTSGPRRGRAWMAIVRADMWEEQK